MDKKERIFEAAHEILGEQGFYGLSIAMVAKKAKVAAGTIYRYFSDKDDLVRQLYLHTILKCHPQIMEGVQIEEVSYRQYRVSIHRNSIDTGKMRRSSLDPTFLLA